jgi:hypothetical protein
VRPGQARLGQGHQPETLDRVHQDDRERFAPSTWTKARDGRGETRRRCAAAVSCRQASTIWANAPATPLCPQDSSPPWQFNGSLPLRLN